MLPQMTQIEMKQVSFPLTVLIELKHDVCVIFSV
jgi:hypothetical protein